MKCSFLMLKQGNFSEIQAMLLFGSVLNWQTHSYAVDVPNRLRQVAKLGERKRKETHTHNNNNNNNNNNNSNSNNNNTRCITKTTGTRG